ncbi:hypothetical protein BBK36DRAFT_1203909 [Trichoderma citrinoviride]|uniref:Uncharacterized protein n=1 Tax=Trichoderma citrinoviride TaxID=58853 RepID=A0A2T4B6R5_9HYPO|nr:hypothetical protein BBK36DRAFT_1203909 [Trichoderma citrinoviride]PTB65023.1 hypothetical protein BBK36DRAFT_1203909 [Trichoderma citrinoviride]
MATYTHAPHRPAKTDGRLSPGTRLIRAKVVSTGKREAESRDQPQQPMSLYQGPKRAKALFTLGGYDAGQPAATKDLLRSS